MSKAAKKSAPKKAAKAAKPKTAAPGKKRAATAKKDDAKPADTSYRLPSKKFLNDLLDSQFAQKTEIESLAGEMGSEIREAADSKHLHKGAFSIAKRLEFMYRKNPKRFQEMYEHLREYLTMCDFDRKAAEQGKLTLVPVSDEAITDDGEPAEEVGEEQATFPGLRVVDDADAA